MRAREIGSGDRGAVAGYVGQAQVCPGEHSEHLGWVDASHVDPGDSCVGLGAAHEGEMHRVRRRQIGHIPTCAGHQSMVLDSEMGQRLEIGDVVHVTPL